jgi:hypothetical protein
MINNYIAEYSLGTYVDLPKHFVAAIITRENELWNPNAKTYEANVDDYSYGLMQVRCDTARFLGFTGDCDDLLDPDTGINYGIAYLQYQLQRYCGTSKCTPEQLICVFSSYNAGTCNLEKNCDNYVKPVMTNYYEYVKWDESLPDKGEENYCRDICEFQGCGLGRGGCNNDDECVGASLTLGETKCKNVGWSSVKICCYENQEESDCEKDYDNWMNNPSSGCA